MANRELKNNQSTGKCVIYTAIFGAYDELIEPRFGDDIFDYVCFTDRDDLSSNIWKIIKVPQEDGGAATSNRMYKMLPHKFLPEYESSIYVDGNIEVVKNPIHLFNESLSAHSLAFPSHFSRNNIYDEAYVLLRSGRLNFFKAIFQMCEYRRAGFISQVKMGEHNILLRRHSDTKLIMESWWSEYIKYPSRDQLSLSFVLWKERFVSFIYLDQTARKGDYFQLIPHKQRNIDPYALKILRIIAYQIPFYILKKLYLKKKSSLYNSLRRFIYK